MGRPIVFDPVALLEAYNDAPGRSRAARIRSVCQRFGCSPPTVLRVVKGRARSSQSRSPSGPTEAGLHSSRVLRVGHPATMEHRTLFPTTVHDIESEWVLKEGKHSAKLGSVIEKGAWSGFPIYSLTLEERATCPTSCRHWGSCFGNNMQFARRWRHGAALEWRLEREVASLELRHPRGFAVRLHTLGDFYSLAYVDLWRMLLVRHAALHVFGFTARIDADIDPICRSVARMVRELWPRFAIRFSNATIGRCSTVSIESPVQKPASAFICPAQWTPSGKKTECCATCALCWSTTKPVAFLQH